MYGILEIRRLAASGVPVVDSNKFLGGYSDDAISESQQKLKLRRLTSTTRLIVETPPTYVDDSPFREGNGSIVQSRSLSWERPVLSDDNDHSNHCAEFRFSVALHHCRTLDISRANA